MTRKHAEKIANAIEARARRNGNDWKETTFPIADVATALKKSPEMLRAELVHNIPLIWGCMPMGWAIGVGTSDNMSVMRRSA